MWFSRKLVIFHAVIPMVLWLKLASPCPSRTCFALWNGLAREREDHGDDMAVSWVTRVALGVSVVMGVPQNLKWLFDFMENPWKIDGETTAIFEEITKSSIFSRGCSWIFHHKPAIGLPPFVESPRYWNIVASIQLRIWYLGYVVPQNFDGWSRFLLTGSCSKRVLPLPRIRESCAEFSTAAAKRDPPIEPTRAWSCPNICGLKGHPHPQSFWFNLNYQIWILLW